MKLKYFFFVFLMLVCSPAHAQVFLEQGKVNLLVHPGEHINDTVTVDNTSGKAVKVKVYWEDFSYQPPFDGAKKFAPAGTIKTSLVKWVQFSPRSLDLPPFGKANISYVIDVPSDAHGGYYGVLFVEPQNLNFKEGDKGVKIITRVGCLFFVETGDRIKKATVDKISVHGNVLKGQLRNGGNVVLLPQSSFYMMDREGLAADRGELKKYYLPPGESADLELPLSRDLSTGEYTLVLTFDLQDGDVLVKEIELSKISETEYRVRSVRD